MQNLCYCLSCQLAVPKKGQRGAKDKKILIKIFKRKMESSTSLESSSFEKLEKVKLVTNVFINFYQDDDLLKMPQM